IGFIEWQCFIEMEQCLNLAGHLFFARPTITCHSLFDAQGRILKKISTEHRSSPNGCASGRSKDLSRAKVLHINGLFHGDRLARPAIQSFADLSRNGSETMGIINLRQILYRSVMEQMITVCSEVDHGKTGGSQAWV